ncbi:hypothetical protein DL93DRAFT_2145638 [Clavulina sp. PMI_390]|nr:hypothetical protein DL93DRAFT_2145638 [Clavulina sp. PMI_390]
MLSTISPKFDPKNPIVVESESPNYSENIQIKRGQIIPFNKELNDSKYLADNLRVFSNLNHPEPADEREPIATEELEHQDDIPIHTDGSCIDNGSNYACAGSGIWFGHDDPRNCSIRVGDNLVQSNNTGEMLAILEAARRVPATANIHIKTDSMWVIRNLTVNEQANSSRGYIGVKNGKLIQATVSTLKMRSGSTDFEWVKGHSGIEGNEEADTLAALGAKMPEGDVTNLIIPHRHHLTGARLSTANQRTLYKGICQKKRSHITICERTKENLESARLAAVKISGTNPTDERIWSSLLRNPNHPNNIRVFLWKLMHDAHKVGPYWRRIPDFRERSQCTGETCDGVLENMQHILFECPHNQGKAVWKIAKRVLRNKDVEWPEDFNISYVRACGIVEIHKEDDENDARRAGATRLFTIIISECAFMIWKLRNKRVFEQARVNEENNDEGPDESEPEISRTEAQNKILSALDTRLATDCLTLRIGKLSKKMWGKHKQKVLNTWSDVVVHRDGSSLPEDWTKMRGVLVGRLRRQPLDNG